MSVRVRRGRRLHETGSEPDVRFSFANERTYLAWCRTALAMTAGGVALESFAVAVAQPFRAAAAGTLLVAGIGLPALAWSEWMSSERALRMQSPLRRTRLGTWLAATATTTGALVLLGALVS